MGENLRRRADVAVSLVQERGRKQRDRHKNRGAAACVYPNVAENFLVVGQRNFGADPWEYKHDAQASVFARKALTRLRFVLVWPTKVVLPK